MSKSPRHRPGASPTLRTGASTRAHDSRLANRHFLLLAMDCNCCASPTFVGCCGSANRHCGDCDETRISRVEIRLWMDAARGRPDAPGHSAGTLTGASKREAWEFLKVATEVATVLKQNACKYWSERRDLNSGPLAPHAEFGHFIAFRLPSVFVIKH